MATPSPAAGGGSGGRVLNVNVGILGHVDSGKTSLVRALSTELSTAALDKHPQSQERGITLDLGFSAFTVPAPAHVAAAGYDRLQFTLVDCPGHASLIRTIIGGASIMDAMVLVVDAVKGVQTQTAECLVLAEIMTDTLVVALNKVDLLQQPQAAGASHEGGASGSSGGGGGKLEAVTARVRKVLASTKFAAAPMVALSAAPGGGGKMGAAAPLAPSADGAGATATSKPQGANVAELVALLTATVPVPARAPGGPALFAVDHCFPIKGQGTVLTGTVLAGSVAVGDELEVPALRTQRRVKSIQMFRKPVGRIGQGDRAGVCVAGLDAASVERSLLCTPGAVPTLHSAVALVRKVRFYRAPAPSGSRFHVSVGHETVMATVVFYGARELAAAAAARGGAAARASAADADAEAAAIVAGFSGLAVGTSGGGGGGSGADAGAKPAAAAPASLRRPSDVPPLAYDWAAEFVWQDGLLGGKAAASSTASAAAGGTGDAASTAAQSPAPLVYEWQWAALLFDRPLTAPLSSLVIGSRLDSDVTSAACRIAFNGRLAEPLPSNGLHELARARIYRRKLKRGVVDRLDDTGGGGSGGVSLIGRGLFKKEVDMGAYAGLAVHTRHGQAGVIDGAFGKAGKFKATFPAPERVNPQLAAELAEEEAAAATAAAGGDGAPAAASGKRKGGGAPAYAPLPGAVPDAAGFLAVAPPPAIRPGDPLYLRYRKYQYQGEGGRAGAAGDGKKAAGGGGAGPRIVQ